MRQVAKRCNLMLTLILFIWVGQQNAYGNDEVNDKSKKKEFLETYNVTRSSVLKTDNRYGNTTITPWNKDQIEIRVVVESKASSESRAQEAIDRVIIDIKQSGQQISAITSLRNTRSNNDNSNERLTIHYFISLPSYMTLNLEQKYGNITMPDKYDGKCDLNVKYGNLYAGSFTNDLVVDCKYSNLTIRDSKNLTLEVEYCGGVDIGDGDVMDIEAKYSNLTIGKVKALKIEMKYGNMEVKSADKMDIDVKYSQVTVDLLTNELNIRNLSYGTLNVGELSKNFSKVYASARYGNLNIRTAGSTAFKLHASSMKYGSCKLIGFGVTPTDTNKNQEIKCDINGGGKGTITFDGNNYSHISIEKLK